MRIKPRLVGSGKPAVLTKGMRRELNLQSDVLQRADPPEEDVRSGVLAGETKQTLSPGRSFR
ncbi:hypothetical protein [Rhizobium sp. SAFR-030]|uniref:hypothetical protein n=1 Tax=Rhizobium sp. SAFR-030 TaxID=3387277 RepID=UPI003F7F3439